MQNVVERDIELALAREKYALEEFRKLYKLDTVDYSVAIVPKNKNYLISDWSAKDYLGDIVYWHESFARNIADVAEGRGPSPIKESLRDAIIQGVAESRSVSVAGLLRRLTKAQKIIELHIFNASISTVPYKKGSRPYNRVEYLDIRTSEFSWHFWDVLHSLLTTKR